MTPHPLTARLYLELGARVRRERERRELTQDELAVAVSVSRSSIANIERGQQHAPIHVVLGIAETLEVDMAQLLPTHAELVTLVDRSRVVPQVVTIAGKSSLMPSDVVHLVGELLTKREKPSKKKRAKGSRTITI